MTSKGNIVISIVFAAIMIVAAIMIDDKEHAQLVVLMLIALWFMPFTHLHSKQAKA